jgi:hypothetical protein
VNGVEEFLALGVGALRGQEGGGSKTDDRANCSGSRAAAKVKISIAPINCSSRRSGM